MNDHWYGRLLAAGVLAFIVPLTMLPAAADDGAATFTTSCAGCHGQNGAGDTPIGKTVGAPDLRSPQVQNQPDARLADVIENGTSKMPPFKSSLTGEQIKGLIAYVRALAKTGGGG